MDTADVVVTPFGMSASPDDGDAAAPPITLPQRRVRRGPVANGSVEEETTTSLISDTVHGLRELARKTAGQLDAVLDLHLASDHWSTLRVVGHDRRLAAVAAVAISDAAGRLARIHPLSADGDAMLLHRLIGAWLDAARGGAALGAVAEGLRTAAEYPVVPKHWLRHHSWLAAIHAGIGRDAVETIVRAAAGID